MEAKDREIPKVVREEAIKIGDAEFKVMILDDGRRILSEDDFKKAIGLLGFTE